MLDLTILSTRFESAFQELSDALARLMTEVNRAEQAAASAVAAIDRGPSNPPLANDPSPTRHELPKLSRRSNIHAVPTLRPLPTPVPDTVGEGAALASTPNIDELAAKVVRLILAATTPPTFESLRRSLQVRKTDLAALIDVLVASGKIRVINEGDDVVCKPARIEPIRRRRVQSPIDVSESA